MQRSRRAFLKCGVALGALASRRDGIALGAPQPIPRPNLAPVVRTTQTAALNIGFEDSGDPRGFPIVLLHGFPDDVRAWDGVAPALAGNGYRVLVPYLRGYGATHFRDPLAPRMAEQAAIGQDLIDFADSLAIPRF